VKIAVEWHWIALAEDQMPTVSKLAAQQKLTDAFYWVGITMSILCVVLVLARNTALVARFDHGSVPAAWAAGLIAIVAFLAFEYFEPAPPAKQRAPRYAPEPVAEIQWETEFGD
jgi:hypothetical protein